MNISHPAPTSYASRAAVFEGPQGLLLGDDDAMGHGIIGRAFEEPPPADAGGNIEYRKADDQVAPPPLPSRIHRVFYINSVGSVFYFGSASEKLSMAFGSMAKKCILKPILITSKLFVLPHAWFTVSSPGIFVRKR